MSTGKQLLDLAEKHIGEKYVFGAMVPFENSNYKGPWDCAEFVSWVVYQSSKIKVGIRGKEAYTGYWASDVGKLCTQISVSDAAQTYGAILFRSPGYKGIKIGHIAFSDGVGGTIEAKSSKDNVCRSTIAGRQWEYGILINDVVYQANKAFEFDYSNPPFNFYVSTPLMKHSIVEETKRKLASLKIYHGNFDQSYDKETSIAVSNYQALKGLVVDGVLGKNTLTSLKVKQYTQIEKSLIWFKQNFENKIWEKINNTPFDLFLLMAIAYQETGFVWSRMIDKTTVDDLLMSCTGDTLDFPNRKAFPKDKTELLAHPNGDKMFQIARKALKNIGRWDSVYNTIYETKPDKFCHGYGIFQYDLQFFKSNPNFFLSEGWGNMDKLIELAVSELHAAQSRIPSLKGKSTLSANEKIYVAIAYNKGTADVTKDFKQGHKNSEGKYYGELVNDYYRLASQL
ncbi:hypothetical protein L1276_002554 [Flavobacterium sp. HSC-32F16]|uniref:peptidoglycan-binding protein n=1 Tax=Flavobacterium sp. HSC-32F16 TaxID=2910964 RepID=UPI0020A2F8F0|nr:peptidoglycan-binding protein [Flavobacterium sp. HSC-32F16]MCP2027397.1 hypothetical protein [Flavobacterium sp. HSC-32F16]